MHIPDGLLDAKTYTAAYAAAALPVGYALYRVRREFADRTAPLMGVVAACLFAAQMINFPVPGGTSGHLLGGVLAAVMLGPWSGLVVLTVVLAVQSVLFNDGGITALGANILNLGVIGSLLGYAIFDPLRRWVGGQAGTVAGSVVAAWFSVVLGATACSVEVSLGGTLPLGPTLAAMLLAHTLIGIGEAIITGMVVSFVLATRPDLVHRSNRQHGVVARSAQVVIGGLAIALVISVLLSPFASTLPDGLEWALARLGHPARGTPLLGAPLPDYRVPGYERFEMAGSAAAALGTLAVFGIAFLLARGLRHQPASGHTPDAS